MDISWNDNCNWECLPTLFGPQCQNCSVFQGAAGLAELKKDIGGIWVEEVVYVDGYVMTIYAVTK